MNAPTATVLRGPSVVNEVRDLLDQLARVDELHDACMLPDNTTAIDAPSLARSISITPDEVREVIARRRSAITNKLENKGLRIAPDPFVGDHADGNCAD